MIKKQINLINKETPDEEPFWFLLTMSAVLGDTNNKNPLVGYFNHSTGCGYDIAVRLQAAG